MANRRDLKKAINAVCTDLFSEGVAASLYGAKNGDNMKEILTSILFMRNDFICRVSHVEPGMKPKKYFNAVMDDFRKHVSEIVEQF